MDKNVSINIHSSKKHNQEKSYEMIETEYSVLSNKCPWQIYISLVQQRKLCWPLWPSNKCIYWYNLYSSLVSGHHKGVLNSCPSSSQQRNAWWPVFCWVHGPVTNYVHQYLWNDFIYSSCQWLTHVHDYTRTRPYTQTHLLAFRVNWCMFTNPIYGYLLFLLDAVTERLTIIHPITKLQREVTMNAFEKVVFQSER